MQATTTNKKARRGLSNVMGSLLLIILTAVSALLVGHYVFAMMNTTQHNPSLAITDVSAINPGNAFVNVPVYVQFTVYDNGNTPIVLQQIDIAGIVVSGFTIYIEPGQTVSFNATITYSSGTYHLTLYDDLGQVGSGSASSIQSSTGTLNVGSTIVVQALGYIQGSQPLQWVYTQTPVTIQD